MGNSHSSHSRLYEDDDESSQAQDISRYLSSSSLHRDAISSADHLERSRESSPVVSDLNEPEEAADADIPSYSSATIRSNLLQAEQEQISEQTTCPRSTDREEGAIPLGLNIHRQNQQQEPNMWDCLADTPDDDEMWDARVLAQATCSFLSADALLFDEWDNDGRAVAVQEENGQLTSTHGTIADGIGFSDLYSRPSAGLFFPWMPANSIRMSDGFGQTRQGAHLSSVSGDDMPVMDFYPPTSQHYEWMGRSIETLLTGHCTAAPMLALPEAEHVEMAAKETGHTLEQERCTRRTSVSSLDAHRSPHRAPRRISLSRGATNRRSNSVTSSTNENSSRAGPNVLLSLLAREGTGKPTSRQTVPPTKRLREMGGSSLYNAVDRPAGGIVSDVALLEDAIDRGDWTETQIIISRLAPRLVGDPSLASAGSDIDDPSLPPSAPRFHAGGGRLGLEREAFVLSGGVQLLLRVFREPAFVGDEIVQSNDARDLSDELVQQKLASCWNEVIASLRELVYALPLLVENGDVLDGGDFVPFLFTLLAHDHCFDGAAALIEEILSSQSNSQQSPSSSDSNVDDESGMAQHTPTSYSSPPSTFFLGNVPDLYELLDDFSCRQLAHFCRLLALLIFEPEDRQVLDSPSVLRSVDLLQIRRDRAARAGRDSTVDMNQAILIGNANLMERLLMLLRVMNFAPPLTCGAPFHVMAHYPFISGTLPMVGLSEISDFREVDRLESLARTMMTQSNDDELLSDLGTVADMLDSLSSLLRQEPLEQSNQIGHIINVINAAQQAGVVVGTPNRRRPRRRVGTGRSRVTTGNVENHASAVATLTDPRVQHSLHSPVDRAHGESEGFRVVRRIELEGGPAGGAHVVHRIQVNGSPQMRITSPEDAANELQFNAFMLSPFQVEVLFVLSTLIGGRRKIDSQNILKSRGLVDVLDDLFERLPFGSSATRSSTDRGLDASDSSQPQEGTHGIHGPGCECTPESAMSVQFLRLLHNFCDRDCDNHKDRRLLLNVAEREFVFSKSGSSVLSSNARPGLLSKVIQAFMTEADDSPYRFWLASCVESFLRGSSTQEQLFVAQSGLLPYLVDHVTSDRLHCAGSLQTSFDLLGELCKGNFEVVESLLSHVDEQGFESLMKVAATNLVDSNVFVRSLILTVERYTASQPLHEVGGSCLQWTSKTGPPSRFYLTHSWWNPETHAFRSSRSPIDEGENETREERDCDNARPSDWFPPFHVDAASRSSFDAPPSGSPTHVTLDYHDWVFSLGSVESFGENGTYLPRNNLERLRWFLYVNRAQLLKDLCGVVSLESINHENICCLNTAIIVMIFAHRRGELRKLLNALKATNDRQHEHLSHRSDDGTTIVERMQALDIVNRLSHEVQEPESASTEVRGTDAIHNFRELIWFWTEYYLHRGRDRISLEFSSHTRFREWRDVVFILSADDGTSASLVAKPPRLPRSPYHCAPRVFEDNHQRGY